MKNFIVLLSKVNVPRMICDHLFDKNHSDTHRMVVGVIIMGFGVMVSKTHTTIIVLHYIFDGFGYAIHGLGVTPFIEKLTSLVSGDTKEQPTETPKPKAKAKPKAKVRARAKPKAKVK